MADTSYQPSVYRKQGGDELVIASSGSLTIESGGAATVESGGSITVESGGSLTIDSGGTLAFSAGSLAYNVPQTLTTTQTATAANPVGVTFLTGTTTGPTYTLGTGVAGYAKDIALLASSSGATHRALLYAGTTGKTFGNIPGDYGNTLTLATSVCTGVRLVASSSLAWRVTGVVGTLTLSNKAT